MIKILKYVYNALSTDVDVSAVVGDDIFPVVVPDSNDSDTQVKFPHIVMQRTSIEPTHTKNPECRKDDAVVEVTIWDTSYGRGVDIADLVVEALDNKGGVYEDIVVDRARFQGAAEGFEGVAYYQSLTFSFR